MTKPTALPVSLQERSDILDILRGFALLGILLDNIFGFTGYMYASGNMRAALSTAFPDKILRFLETAFVHGKFYSLFSLLFGIGFSVILLKAEQKAINPLIIFYRRLFILLIIGAIHVFLIWEGDILFTYALIGLLLPLFRKCSDKTLLIWAILLIASPLLIDLIKVMWNFRTGSYFQDLAMDVDKKHGVPLDDGYMLYLFKEGSGWQEWRNWQASGVYYRFSDLIETNRIPKVLGLFLLGFYTGRRLIYVHLNDNIGLFKKLRLWGYTVGVPASLALAYVEGLGRPVPDKLGLLETFLYAISVVPLSLAYASTICLWWMDKKEKSLLRWMKAPGRMALTNYLLQTFLGIAIFYGVGFGLGGNIGPTIFIPIVFIIYFVQILLSNWWLRHFNYGPMEWLWRQLTYMKRLPLKKQSS